MTSIYSKLIDLLTQRRVAQQMTEELIVENREEILAIEQVIDGYQARRINLRKDYMQYLQSSAELSADDLKQKLVLSTQIDQTQVKLAEGKKRLDKLNKRQLQLQNRRNLIEVQVHHIEKRCQLVLKEERDRLQVA